MDSFQNTGQPDWDWWGRLWPAPGETLRDLGLTPDTSLVEIGRGNGYFALPAARIVDPAPVYALDIDDALLEELERIANQQAIDTVVPIEGDARSLATHLPEPVDACLVANLFHGVNDRSELVRQLSEALEPDGALVVINWDGRSRETTTVAGEPRGPPTALRLSSEETERAVCAETVFTTDRYVELPPYHYALRFERSS
ncbi:class I SAM-dependent methyltransferase [Natrialbaceae archaeon A-arb3/5]